MKVVLITGGSSGIGRAAARLFHERGWRVYELSRRENSEAGITHLTSDVTDRESVRRAVETVWKSEGRIDLLVNNAGMGISGPVEFASGEDVRRQFDVNFFGALAVTQEVIPLMRKQKGGTILFVTSVASPVAIPFQAFYSASKAALQSLSDSLRNELALFGIRVSSILPGDTHTGFTDARVKNGAGEGIYGRAFTKSVSSMEKDERNGMTPESAARVIFRAGNVKNPRVWYTVGTGYKLLVFLERILPARLVRWIVGKLYA